MDEEGPAEQRHQEEEADREPALSGGTQQIVAGLTKNRQHRDERQRNERFPGGRRAGPSGDDSHGSQDEDQGDSGGEDPVPRIMSCTTNPGFLVGTARFAYAAFASWAMGVWRAVRRAVMISRPWAV